MMLYHTNWSPRGLFGVDVFFVISGFLITLLMLRELADTGRMRVGAFFGRRVKRLLPGLLVTLAAILVTAWFVSDVRELAEIGGQSWWALWQGANWAQIADGTAYWDATGQFRPLAQMWSLSMTEQFYLVWPFLVLTAWFCCRRHPGALAIVLVLLAAAAALVAPLLWDGSNSDRLYLGTDARAVAFVAGAAGAAAVFWIRSRISGSKSPGRASRAVVSALSVLSLVGVVGASVVATSYHEPWLYQGGLAFVAVSATVFVATLCFPVNVLVPFFSFSLFRGIGVVSYSVFLLHLPVYWVLQKLTPTIAPLTLFFVGATLTWLLAAFLHHGITERIRRAKWRPWPTLPVLLVAVGLIAAGSHYLPLIRAQQASAVDLVPDTSGGLEMPPGMEGGRPLVVTLGDSLANDLAAALIGHGNESVAVVDGGQGGCGIMPATKVRASSGYEWDTTACPDWRTTWAQTLSAQPTDAVVVHLGWDASDQFIDGRWLSPKDPEYVSRYSELLDEVVDLVHEDAPAARIVLVADRPTNGIITDPTVTAAYTLLLQQAADRHPEVRLADMGVALCGTGTCRTTDTAGRELFLSDNVHLTPAGKDFFAPWIEQALRDALVER
ncbi:acyltransferase [Microbacterium resistens]|uniref:Acyltransferase n=2 Tax=Microbacterium resistens TaxID=156977 RepID=A0ABY3RPW3_9MICO|nr:acyltransferase [Microbacterium resistens]